MSTKHTLRSRLNFKKTSGPRVRARRIVLNVLIDGFFSAMAAPLARWLADPAGGLLHPLWFIAGGGITLFVSGVPFRIPQQYWRFIGIADLFNIACASALSAFLFALLLLVSGYPLPTPTFPIIHALTILMLLGSVRMFWRVLSWRRSAVSDGERFLLLGADRDMDLFMRALERGRSGQRVVGLLTDGAQQAGRRIHGRPILGTIDEAEQILARLSAAGRLPDSIVLTAPLLRGAALSTLLVTAQGYGVKVQRAPTLTALKPAERVELSPIALEELLNRPPVTLDTQGMERLIAGQVVLLTGAGGSIGSELARQISSFAPAELVLLENNEYALWKIGLDLSERFPALKQHRLLVDVRDERRVSEVFAAYRPALVFHAAALKHVPIVEDNPVEGLLTNTIGTRIVADCAQAIGVRAMVMISTDKAVHPSSLMGASKRCAEIYGQALDMQYRAGAGGLCCVTVRFGNVLGSTGSVVPLFRRQLEQGGPLTVTHPEMTRYFMTVPEAVGLVLQAAVRGTQKVSPVGEGVTDRWLRRGGIFVLDMGEPVRIMDLARQMIRLAGLKPDEDVKIQITGLRPGEKLSEELFYEGEFPIPADMSGLQIVTPRTVDLKEAMEGMRALEEACRCGNLGQALRILCLFVPEFVPEAVLQSAAGAAIAKAGTPPETPPGTPFEGNSLKENRLS